MVSPWLRVSVRVDGRCAALRLARYDARSAASSRAQSAAAAARMSITAGPAGRGAGHEYACDGVAGGEVWAHGRDGENGLGRVRRHDVLHIWEYIPSGSSVKGPTKIFLPPPLAPSR